MNKCNCGETEAINRYGHNPECPIHGKEASIKESQAYWNNEEDEETQEDISSYEWTCPNCGDPNIIGDDMVWNGKKGKHITKDSMCCEYCDSDEEFFIWRS